jgi:hypothetical protein
VKNKYTFCFMIIFITIFSSMSFRFQEIILQNDSSISNEILSNNISFISTTPFLSTTPIPISSSTRIPTLGNTPVPFNGPFYINDFHMIDAENGFVLGLSSIYGTSLYKTNGLVRDWTILFPADPDFEKTDTHMKNMIMYVYGSKNIWLMTEEDLFSDLKEVHVRYSNNGGFTFEKSNPLPLSIIYGTVDPVQLFFLNKRIGWLLTVIIDSKKNKNIIFFHTSDGGRNWENIYELPLLNSCYYGGNLDRFIFIDENIGYFTGICPETNGNVILSKTSDGGKTWQSDDLFAFTGDLSARANASCEPGNFYQDLNHILHVSIICFNDSGYSQSFSFSRMEDGKNWGKIISKRGIFFITKNKLLNPSAGRESNNGGKDWIQLSEDEYSIWADEIQAVTDDLLFARQYDGLWMIKSNDGGDSWQEFSPRVNPD